MTTTVKINGYTYEVEPMQRGPCDTPYVRVALTKPFHDVFIHYPLDLLTPEQHEYVDAQVTEHLGVRRQEDCFALEGAPCAFHVEEGVG